MHFLPTLLAAFTATTALASSNPYPDGAACLVKHPNIYTAIQDFCSKDNMVVPSTYANAGKSHGGKWVGIRGNCSPPQWVPSYYCTTQLQAVCANAPANGDNQATFGRNGCQTFVTWAA